jgi:flagellar protein FlaG
VFELRADSRELVIKIVDRQNNRVIREIPPEEMQRLRAAMRGMAGLLLDHTG